ncbi:MAG TPA: MFS transporter [Stellaceae bacterium]|nr:MFS transporter [Stellaceae bacterium]
MSWRRAFSAGTLDAFDFFLLVFVLTDIAGEFGTRITEVTFAILLTLVMRPVGAFLFGRAADRYGRRRGMFMIGVLPALLVLFIRRSVPESPSSSRRPAAEGGTLAVLRAHWRLGVYAIVLMTAFNFFSHGSQDLYPTFLEVQLICRRKRSAPSRWSTTSGPSWAASSSARGRSGSAAAVRSSSPRCCRCRPCRSG